MRKLTTIFCLTLAVLLGSLGTVDAGWFGPSTYGECVLKGLKTSETEYETRVVESICRDKFPSKEKKRTRSKPLKYEPELDKNGIRVCRVYSVDGSYKFLTKEK